MKHYYPHVSDLSTRDLTKLIFKAVTELKHRDSPERVAADELSTETWATLSSDAPITGWVEKIDD